MRSSNPFTQKVNFIISAFFIASFGFFLTTKIIDFVHAANPIVDAVAATQQALKRN
jgi:hypothetical protein